MKRNPMLYNLIKDKLITMKKTTQGVMQNDNVTAAGGISVKKGLLPNSKVGQIYIMKVVSIDNRKVYLQVVKK